MLLRIQGLCAVLSEKVMTHVWGIMATHNGAIFHASSYLLQKLDDAQRHFLEELGMSEAIAFCEHNFAPPSLRRDIGVLGLLQKRVLGKAHPIFQKLLPFFFDVFGFLRPEEHNKQLYGHFLEVHFQQALHFRSIFGMASVYNDIPQDVVDSTTVSAFQKSLTLTLRKACQAGNPKWMHLFSCRA